MPRRMLLVPIAALALLVAACGSSGAASDPSAVRGKSYATTEKTVDGAQQQLALGGTMTVSFIDNGVSVNAGCNTMFAAADLSNGTVALDGPMAGTRMACDPALMAQDDEIAAFFASSPRWSLEGEQLMLGNDSTMFMLDPAPNS